MTKKQMVVVTMAVLALAGCGEPIEFGTIPPRAGPPVAIPVSQDVASFLKNLGEAYGSKDSAAVRDYLARDFLFQGMDRDAFMEHLAVNQAYVQKMEIRPLALTPKADALEVTAYGVMTRGTLAPSLQVLPLNAGATLVKEDGQWRLRGNQQWQEQGLYLHQIGLAGNFPPADLAVYRGLIPKGWRMPPEPLVQLAVIEWRSMAYPQVPYRLAQLSIRVAKDDREAWFYVEMPETDWLAVEAGKALGFPKYVVDLPIEKLGDEGWRASVHQAGKELVSASFSEDLSALSQFKERSRNGLIVLPGGPALDVSMEPIGIPAQPRFQPGWMTVAPGATGRWKSLLSANQRAPAMLFNYVGPLKLVIPPLAN